MKILVTGGLGYIGSYLCEMLTAKGHEVDIYDIGLFTEDTSFKKRDIKDTTELVKAVEGKDVIIHLAALVGDPACNKDKELCVETNSVATAALVEAARAFNIKKFIFVSTCSIYGFSEEIVDEESGVNPITLYGFSKFYSENVVKTFPNNTLLRLATVFGISKRPRFDLVLNVLAAKAAKEGKIEIHGGEQWRPFVHVKDAARAIVFALENDLRGIYNVGGYNLKLRDLGRLIAEKTGCELKVIEKKEDPRSYHVKFDKLAKTGYKMEKTLENGIEEIAEFVKTHDYTNKRYYNHEWV